jgi:protein-L-isoaspartate(D-aspartate) O-methyltransferase
MNITTAAEALRAHMVDDIIKTGPSLPGRIEEALRTVPRHEFVPAAPLEEAYANQAVITKRSRDGAALSCASVPTLVAAMLSQLGVRRGDRILEIGAGTGYNAALLAHLAGPSGQVTTIDIDPDVTQQARQALDQTGYRQVNVITKDGTAGDAAHAPYDRIIVTVGAWDIPPAWWQQLTPGGRLVVPLRWRGQTRSVAFTPEQGRLRSCSVELCGFVPMIGQDGERTGHIDDGGQVALYWDADQAIDPAALRGILTQPATRVWSGATVGANEPFDGIWLRLTGTEPGTCRIGAEPAAVETGLCTPAIPSRSPALAESGSLAYFTLRRPGENGRDAPRWELGAVGHGPAGPQLADRLCGEIRAWNRDRAAQPVITAYPARAAAGKCAAGLTIEKRYVRLVVSPSP